MTGPAPDPYTPITPDTVGHLRLLSVGDIDLDIDGRQVHVAGRRVDLTRREFDLLQLLMENAGRVLTRRAILDQLWGAEYPDSNKTLEVHVRRLRLKIDTPTNAHIRTVRSIGYIVDIP